MGRQIVYCDGCGKSLLEQDFEKGKAHTVDFRPFCTTCKPLEKKTPSSAAVPALKSSSKQIPIAPRPAPNTARVPKTEAPRKSPLALLVAGAGGLFLLVIVIAVASGGRKSAPRTEGETTDVAPIIVERPVAPRQEPVRVPREEELRTTPKTQPPPAPAPAPAPPAPKPPPPPPPDPPKIDPALLKWQTALAPATGRDYSTAVEALKAAGVPTGAVDAEYVKKVAAMVQETHQLLAKWPRGKAIALEFVTLAGKIEKVDGPVERAGLFRLEVRKGEETVTVELGEIAARSLAEVFRNRAGSRPPIDNPVAALLCLLEGDLESARADLSSVPERFAEYAAKAAEFRAAEEPRDLAARRACAEALQASLGAATALDAVAKLKALLSEFAGTGFVRRNRASLEARAGELGREYFFVPSDVAVSGAFKPGKVPKAKVESCWISERDVGPAQAKETFLEIAYGALPAAEYRCWVYAGGCCLETLGFSAQADGQAAAAPVKLPVLNLRNKHAQHTGPKQPERWVWVPVPVPKSASGGVKSLRLFTDQKGFGLAYAIVTSQRQAPPKDSEIGELVKGRAGAPPVRSLSTDDLVGYWRFDENAGGTVADASGKGHGGQFRGDAKWGPGKSGSGLLLAANDGFVEVPDAPDLNPPAITMAAWVKLPALPTKVGNILAKGQNAGYRFRVANNGIVEVFDRGDSNGLRTTEGVPLNRWVHIAVTGDASGLRIYLDGRLSMANSTPFGAPKIPHSLKIGAETDFKEYFGGSIDEVCLYKRALSPSEIQLLYRLGPK